VEVKGGKVKHDIHTMERYRDPADGNLTVSINVGKTSKIQG
jgi:hypothetical protein